MRVGAFLKLIVVVCLTTNSINAHTFSAALLDTTERDPWLYKPLTDSLKAVGFNVVYKPLDAVMDQSQQRLALPRYNAVFFLLGAEFLSGLATQSHICTKVLRLLNQYAQQKGVLVGLVFPTLNTQPGSNIIGACSAVFHCLGLPMPPVAPRSISFIQNDTTLNPQARSIGTFLYLTNVFLSTPPERRPLLYHTTLCAPHHGFQFDIDQIEQALRKTQHPLLLLPIKNDASMAIRQQFPYGLYWFNPLRKNHILITSRSLFTFAGITENFHLCPVNFILRNEMLMMMQRMLWELTYLMRATNPTNLQPTITTLKKTTMPLEGVNVLSFSTQEPPSKSSPLMRTIAWMELNIFQDQKNPQPDQEQRQNQIIDYIYQSGMNALWITFNPHMYYSPIARIKNEEQAWLQSISRFTEKLRAGAQRHDTKPPSILVGYEITNNIYEPNMPKQYAVDMYEHDYKDLPIPLDRSFWRQEITDPLATFIKKWKDPSISHDIPLAGIVLDLEMYCRKKSGTFLNTMGFDALTFNRYAQTMKLPWKSVALRDRPLMLMEANRTTSYFTFLEQQAASIGRDIHDRCQRLIPECQFMCYLPQINVSWFYKGLYKGLTIDGAPLHLLTFNSEFFAHKEWFDRNRIPVYHSSVLMLSKVREPQDFTWVEEILSRNPSVWFNRFSRFIEPQTQGNWMSIEQPGMKEDQYPEFMKYLKRL